MSVPRPEYPRPQFVREAWLNLNGPWDFSFDEPGFDRTITVPFAYQAALSGIGMDERHDRVWYRRAFALPEDWAGKRVLLHFGAVDYTCKVWVNGALAGGHTGGHAGFSLDVTEALRPGENVLTVLAEDDHADREMPRGKQYWGEKPRSIFYTPTSGIWQTVWLEPVSEDRLLSVRVTPDLAGRQVFFDYELSRPGLVLTAAAACPDGETVSVRSDGEARGRLVLSLDRDGLAGGAFADQYAWSPEHPALFRTVYEVRAEAEVTDRVSGYFGLRSIAVADGKILLNGRPYYQKLLLDQGYWPDGLLTAPTDAAFVTDIEACKAMGFNGVRKHQKVEDPRFLYHADRLGLLVWGEMANAYVFSGRYVRRFTAEWMEVLERDYNHPCIVAWTPLNESWGINEISSDPRQLHHCKALVELTKSLDATRLVMSNDGWEQTIPDVLGIHDYEAKADILRQRYASLESILAFRPADRAVFAPGGRYAGQPVMVTECGGISFRSQGDAWGYTDTKTPEEFLETYRQVVASLLSSELVQGFCYTQLTDVQQEQNGLLTFDRRPKFDFAAIREINEG